MNELRTFTFTDAYSGDEVCVVVRYGQGSVALTVSVMRNGDVEVVLEKEVLSTLIDALVDARSRLRSDR